MTLNKLFEKLKQEGGAIVCSSDCSKEEIEEAKKDGRFAAQVAPTTGYLLRTRTWMELTKSREEYLKNVPFGDEWRLLQVSLDCWADQNPSLPKDEAEIYDRLYKKVDVRVKRV